MKVKQIFENVFLVENGKRYIATKNLVKGKKVYGEELVQSNFGELRQWNHFRSKLAAAILNKLNKLPVKKSSKILYLGAGSGTTASHISDIAENGKAFCVELSPRAAEKLIEVSAQRKNMMPIIADANFPLSYAYIEKVDFIYQDIAQRNQSEILIKNSEHYLKKGGEVFLALKAGAISSTEDPEKILSAEIKKLKEFFEIKQIIDLEPYHKAHAMIHLKAI